jgi:iron complex outermembrane receptor protein
MRGSYSTGFRAPSLYDINAAQTYTNTTLANEPLLCPNGVLAPGATRATSCSVQFMSLTGGNQNLKPETSKNTTFGLVFEPMAGLSLGVDFWWIKLEQQIGTLPQDEAFDPAKAAGQYAGLYHRNPQGRLSTDGSECPDPTTCGYVDLRTLNLGGINTNGVDLSANYRLRASESGQFTFMVNSTYVSKYEYQNVDGGEFIPNVGVYSGVGPIFRWQHNASVNWTGGPFGAGLTVHYKSGYLDSPDDVANNGIDPGFRVASYTTFDIFGSWTPVKNATLLLGIKNMFDRAPPLSYQTQTFQAGYDPRFTDPTGRTYYLRGTYTF